MLVSTGTAVLKVTVDPSTTDVITEVENCAVVWTPGVSLTCSAAESVTAEEPIGTTAVFVKGKLSETDATMDVVYSLNSAEVLKASEPFCDSVVSHGTTVVLVTVFPPSTVVRIEVVSDWPELFTVSHGTTVVFVSVNPPSTVVRVEVIRVASVLVFPDGAAVC